MKYTVVLEPQEEGGFTVQCVELPGAISQGEVFSVPLHKELKKGTLIAILKQADITVEEFKQFFR